MGRGSKKGEHRGGRKKGILNKSTAEVKALIDQAGKSRGGMEMVLKRLFELADGITVVEKNGNGNERIYTKPPDGFAARTLLEHRFGRPAQSIEMSTPEGQPFPFCIVPTQRNK
jgi:hypothetical protein